MKAGITKKEYALAEKKMLVLLDITTQREGFNQLSPKQKASLEKYTGIVKAYEDANFTIPMPQTVQG